MTALLSEDLERQFEREFPSHEPAVTRGVALLGVGLFAAFGVIDRQALPKDWPLAWGLRFGIVVPALLLVAWWGGREHSTRHPRAIAAALYLPPIYMLIGLSGLAGSSDLARVTYFPAALLIVLALYTFQNLPLRYAGLLGASTFTWYVIVELTSRFIDKPGQGELAVTNTLYLVSVNCIGLYSAHIRKQGLRRQFLLRLDLASSRGEALQLAATKTRFLANMSHEIRTPLNGVLGLALLGERRASSDGEARATFARIRQAGSLLQRIVDDILDFSKLEADKMTFEEVPVDVRRLVESAGELVLERAREKGLVLRRRVADEVPARLVGDPLRLQQVLLNLMSNAVKFTDSGSVDVEVSMAGAELAVSVRDTGIGMGEDQRRRLFMAFEQADGSISRRFGGTGLGLAISHRIITALGGRIEAESTPGVGSTFTVRLPVRVAPAEVVAAAPASAPAVAPLSGRRVLVAEDNDINQVVIQDLLQGLGAEVDLVGDGQQAIDRVRAAGPDAYHLVLMDVMMPVKDGITATRELRALQPTLPIIGQTAHAFGEERDRCFEAGIVGHVAKPIDPDELLAVTVRHALPPRS